MFRSIVVGAGGSETATGAVLAAAELAERFGATVHLVSVVNAPALMSATVDAGAAGAVSQWRDEATAAEQESMARTVVELGGRGIDVRSHVAGGDPASTLCRVAEEERADLIVVGNRGMRGARRVLGSVPNSVTHQAPCHVLVVRTT